MKLHVINTELFKLDGGAMFGVVPKVIWNKIHPSDENNLCTWAMRCLLIEEGDRKILIDTGIGNKQDAKFMGHYHLHGNHTLENSLREAGFTFDDITDVFLTHLHFDHCGGSIIRKDDRLIPAFPNATYWSNKTHWETATKPNAREKASFLKENILPIEESGKLKFIPEEKDFQFTENIKVRFAYGHTAAMMIPLINYKGRTLAYMADLLPARFHIPLPYVMAYDMNPLITLEEKKAFLDEAAEKKFVLFFEHDPVFECCTLKTTEKGVREESAFSLAEFTIL